MKTTLEKFRINGLYGRKNFELLITENTLIIVGENGSGKTTILRILFHFLSGRWLRLVQFKFESIEAIIDDLSVKISHEEIVKSLKGIDRRVLLEYPPSLRKRVMELIERGEFDRVSHEFERRGIRHSIPPDLMLRQFDLFEAGIAGPQKHLAETFTKIRSKIKSQILYLPTYRRIERELGSIFDGIDSDEIRRQNKPRLADTGDWYIELVEFGMKDVQQAVDRTLESLKEFARENLNNLTLRYLGDVVNQDYQNVGMKEISEVSDETVRAVLDRIHDSILTKAHRDHLAQVINSAKLATSPTEHQKIIYHYFLKLLGFQEALKKKESQITEFCRLCSEYLVDKSFIYDGSTFSFSISPKEELDADIKIELSDLSSGEKQIVSLFSHLHLSGGQKYFVLIDEPELSLSVPWQRRFLTDIRSGSYCNGLIAVTHSPFIYDNSLKQFAFSLGEFESH